MTWPASRSASRIARRRQGRPGESRHGHPAPCPLSGRGRQGHFTRKVDAQKWLDEVTASIVTGQYVDPKAGSVTFREYAEHWRSIQVHRDSSRAHVETMLRRHAYPTLGERPLSNILPSDVQALVKGLELAPATVAVVHSLVSGVMKAAVRDRRIFANPCEGTRLPKVEKARVSPLETATVEALREAMPYELKALITLAAGTGLRQGECFGLTIDRVNFLRRDLGRQTVREALRTVCEPCASEDEAQCPDGPASARRRRRAGGPLGGVSRRLPTGQGLHALRHYYASLLIRLGESVKVVQARLGHAGAAETLDTYSHLWPDFDDRTREAVDAVLGGLPADSLRTGNAS